MKRTIMKYARIIRLFRGAALVAAAAGLAGLVGACTNETVEYNYGQQPGRNHPGDGFGNAAQREVAAGPDSGPDDRECRRTDDRPDRLPAQPTRRTDTDR